MRKALATAGLLGAMSFSVLGASTAATAAAPVQVVVAADVDGDPVEADGDDDSGKWGLAGLTGLVGLFGYKKYREHRTHNRNTGTGTDGATRA